MKRFFWIILALAYVIFPFDIIPDIMLGLGQADDLLVVAYSLWLFFQEQKNSASKQKVDGEANKQNSKQTTKPERPKTPHEILGIEENASEKEIEQAYKNLMAKYHPDKVSHLGEELKELAHKKAIEIQQAYQALKK